MKKTTLFLLLLYSIISYGQNIPVTTDSVAFYADSLSETITLDKSVFLGGLFMYSGRTDSIWFDIYKANGWFTLTDDGLDYVAVVDSSENQYYPLNPQVLYPVKKLRMRINADIADTMYIPYNKRPY